MRRVTDALVRNPAQNHTALDYEPQERSRTRARDGLFGNLLTKGRGCIGTRCGPLARVRDGLFGNLLTKGRGCIGT